MILKDEAIVSTGAAGSATHWAEYFPATQSDPTDQADTQCGRVMITPAVHAYEPPAWMRRHGHESVAPDGNAKVTCKRCLNSIGYDTI